MGADLTISDSISLPRSLLAWEWYRDANTMRLFVHFLLNMTERPIKIRGVELDKGQLITSYPELSANLDLTVKQLRTSLSKLERAGYAAVKKTNRFSVVTVVSAEIYIEKGRQKGAQRAVQKTKVESLDMFGSQEIKKKTPPCPHKEILNMYHEILPECDAVIFSLWEGSTRERDLAARWKQSEKHQDLGFWQWYFTELRTLDGGFWIGANKRGWKVDIKWLIKRENFARICESIASVGGRK